MQKIRMKTNVLSQKLIAHVSPEMARAYGLPEDHQSVAFFSTDNDDVGYLAVDDATKKAKIKVIHARTFYGGEDCTWARNAGGVFIMFSGPRVADVKSGMQYVRDFVETQSQLYNFDGDEGTAFYAQTIPRAGKYFSELYGIKEGDAYAYLVGAPIETNYAIDKALKAGDTRVVHFWFPPSNANSSGAVLTGTESACRAATQAFVEALQFATVNPMNL